MGIPDASCRYASTVWGQIDKPVIGVRPVNHPGVRVSRSVWRGTNAVESWSWRGCEGNKAEIEVYAQAETVELFLNGKSLGRKKLKEYKTMYKAKYESGTIMAVSYDANGRETGKSELHSATGNLRISAVPEETEIETGDIAYIPISLTGENGVTESNADTMLSVSVKGGILLGFGSTNPCTEETYNAGKFKTYQGHALAVVRAQ